MEKDIMNEPLFRERSYVKSISAGIRLPLRHPWGFLRHLWPLLLVCILTWAFVAAFAAPDMWAFRQLAFQSGIQPSALIGLPLVKVLAWGALAMLFLGVECGQIAHLMHRYGTLTYFPVVQPWQVFRSILPHIIRGVVLCVVGYAVTAGLAVLSLAVMPSRLWALVLCVALVFLWAVYYVAVGQRFMFSRQTYLSSFIGAFKHRNRMGGNMAILVSCGLVVVGVMLVGCLPAICTLYVGGISDNAVAIGDPTDLPSNFAFLRGCSFALGALVTFVSWPFMLVPLTFHWGADEQPAETEEKPVEDGEQMAEAISKVEK